MKIAGLQRVSLIDYPDRIAATVFLAGCNLDCGFCHNRWMLSAAQVSEAISVSELLTWLRGRVGLLDGVCISGGEPTINEELARLAHEIKALGFALKLDTNGTRPGALADLIDQELLDYVAMDIKAPLDARYRALVGRNVSPAIIAESMTMLRSSGVAYEFRTTVAPGLDRQALVDIAALLEPGERWYLQVYRHPDDLPEAKGAPALAAEDLHEIVEALSATGIQVAVRGD